MSSVSVEKAKDLEDVGFRPVSLVLVPGPVEAENQVPWGPVGIYNLIRRRLADERGLSSHVGRRTNGMKTDKPSICFGHDQLCNKGRCHK